MGVLDVKQGAEGAFAGRDGAGKAVVSISAGLRLNPAIWETIAATGWLCQSVRVNQQLVTELNLVEEMLDAESPEIVVKSLV